MGVFKSAKAGTPLAGPGNLPASRPTSVPGVNPGPASPGDYPNSPGLQPGLLTGEADVATVERKE